MAVIDVTGENVVSESLRVINVLETTGNHSYFNFHSVRTGYYSDESASILWLKRFFGGFFVPSTDTEMHANVYSTCNQALYTLLQTYHQSSETNDYTELVLSPQLILIHLRCREASSPEDVYFILQPQERKVLIVCSGNPVVRNEHSMQSLRALMNMLMVERGWLPFHAACCARDGRGVCIFGSKTSGKTSTLVNLLEKEGFHLIANDKILLYDEGTYLKACGLPGKAGIRIGTLLCSDKLQRWLEQDTEIFFPHISPQRIQDIAAHSTPEELKTRKEKISFLPEELTGIFGVAIEPTTRLHLFIAPLFQPDAHEAQLLSARTNMSIEDLLENYPRLTDKKRGFFQHFFDFDDNTLLARHTALWSKYLPDLPVYQLQQNGDTNCQAAALVAEAVKTNMTASTISSGEGKRITKI